MAGVTISQQQRQLHMAGEAIAVTLVAPFMFYLSTRKELPAWARVASAGIGIGTLIIDGYLLAQYVSQPACEIGERFAKGEIGVSPVPELVGLVS